MHFKLHTYRTRGTKTGKCTHTRSLFIFTQAAGTPPSTHTQTHTLCTLSLTAVYAPSRRFKYTRKRGKSAKKKMACMHCEHRSCAFFALSHNYLALLGTLAAAWVAVIIFQAPLLWKQERSHYYTPARLPQCVQILRRSDTLSNQLGEISGSFQTKALDPFGSFSIISSGFVPSRTDTNV